MGNGPEKDQRELHEQLGGLGFRVAVVRSVADVDAALAQWTGSAGLTDRQLRDQIIGGAE